MLLRHRFIVTFCFRPSSSSSQRGKLAPLSKVGSGAKVGSDMIAELAADPKVGVDLLEIDDALRALEGADPRASKVVEARIFGGLSIEEAAEALGLSLSTVSRDWRFGRAFLAGQLSQDGDSPVADEEAAS